MDFGSLAGSALSAYTGGLSGATGALGLGSQTGGSNVGGTPTSLSTNTPVDVTSAGPRYYGQQANFPPPQYIEEPINPPTPGQTSVGFGDDPNRVLMWVVYGAAILLGAYLFVKKG